MSKIIKRNKGLSSVFGSVLILLLVVTLASALFISLYAYEEKAEESIAIEEERTQEKIVLLSLSTQNISETEYLLAISVNNTGTITARIRAIYIDNSFVCDPTNPLLNPEDTYINPKDSIWITLPSNIEYDPFSKIEVVTERGMKSIEYEWKLKTGSQAEPPPETQRFHFGPLLLDFEKFYYAENYGSYDPYSWKPGWSVEKGTTLVWNVTVTNIDDRDITINKYSGFTMVSNDGGVQLPWFIEPPDGLDALFIPSNSTAHLIYIWDRPRLTQGVKNQSVYNQNDRSKVFLTFFGIFHEQDGSTKPYGQTIPFEAVLVRDPQMIIAASPATIAASSLMKSTISVTVRDVMGILVPNALVTFTTTHGDLSSYSGYTDSNGIATVTLSAETTGTALVTANWESISKSITVTVASGEFFLSANPVTIVAGTTLSSTITARVTLNGNPLQGEIVYFSADPILGTLSSNSAQTNAQGYATVTLAPGTNIGTTTITANWGTLSQSTQVSVSSGELALSRNNDVVAAGSTMTSLFIAHVKLNGIPLQGETVTFSTTATSTQGILSPLVATTNALGEAAAIFTPGTETGIITVAANWGILSESQILTIAIGQVAVQANPTSITANSSETSTIEVTITMDGQPVSNQFAILQTNSTLVELSDTITQTNASGIATVVLTPGETGEAVEVTATWESLSGSTSINIVEATP